MRSPAVRWCADRRGLADEAADRIRAAVLAGRYAPGAALRESELAALLDVSRGSVREGMALLAREGLIRSGWHRGTTIIDVTAADVEEAYALRAAPVALDVAFHHRAHAAAGNTRLTAAWRTIRSQVHLFHRRRVEVGLEPHRGRVVEEHREISRLLRDPHVTDARLARYVIDHVEAARQDLLSALSQARPACDALLSTTTGRGTPSPDRSWQHFVRSWMLVLVRGVGVVGVCR